MNSPENVEKLFKLNKTKFEIESDEHLFPTYNPNTYLNLDFNTLDNLDLLDMSKSRFNITAKVIQADEDFEVIVNAEHCTNIVYAKIADIPLTFGYHSTDLAQYSRNLNTIAITAHNIIEKSQKDLGNTPEQATIEANIRNQLQFIEDQKKTIRKVVNVNDRLIKMAGFYTANDASFDEEEKSMLFNRLKNHMIDNKEYIGDGVNQKLNKMPEDLLEFLIAIKKETYQLIELAKQKGVNSMYCSLSDQYKQLDINGSPIATFMASKVLETDTNASLSFSKNNINSKVYLMNDNSILYANKNGELETIKNHQELKQLLNAITKDLISDIIPNKPNIVKFFYNIALEEGINATTVSHLINTVNTFVTNQDLLKNIGLNILSLKDKSLEAIDDYLNAESKTYRAKQFSKKILSNKYKGLETQESDNYFRELYDKELSDKDLQNYIGKKLAALKTPEDLVKLLKNVFQQLDGFTEDNLTRKLERFGIEPFYNKDNVVVFKIDNYEQCKELGSPSWCIHRQESYFKTYTSNNCRQFIIYDFDKDSKDTFSIIGFTTHENGTLRTQHLKNDDYIDFVNNPDRKYLSEIHLKAVEVYIPKEDMNEKLRETIFPPKPEDDIEIEQQKKSTKMSNSRL